MAEIPNNVEALNAQAAAVANDQANFPAREDWRVKLTLAPEANYLYRAEDPGILAPLNETNGVVFPYLPQIVTNYRANYEDVHPTHTNYSIYQYEKSKVDSIQITAEFTAQDTFEANYLLAVIHFFKSITKMFYGQDQFPKNGTPPPLTYIYGLGEFQFNAHPLAVSNFQYTLPNNVDYVKTTNPKPAGTQQPVNTNQNSNPRLASIGVDPGGVLPRTPFPETVLDEGTTYVPTHIQLIITCMPIISRNAVSNRFSFKEYATGSLLRGSSNPGGGLW